MSEYIPMYHAVAEIMIITSNRVPRSAGNINHIPPPSFLGGMRVPVTCSRFVFHTKFVCSVCLYEANKHSFRMLNLLLFCFFSFLHACLLWWSIGDDVFADLFLTMLNTVRRFKEFAV